MTKRTSSSFGTTRCRVATANRWTLPITPIAVLLTALLGLVMSSCSSDKTLIVGSTAQDLASLTVVAGDGQTGTVGSMLPTPITARVLTQGGQGVPGISVQWTFPSGGGSLTLGGPVSDTLTSVTDKSGETSVYWQLDTIAGDQTATATLWGTDQTTSSSSKPVKFHSHGKAAGATTVVVSPGADTLAVGDSTQFAATVTDHWGNVISGATMTWSSSNDSVVTVSSSGMANAKRSGSAMITVTTSSASTTSATTGPSSAPSVSGQASVSVSPSSTSTNPPGTVTDLKVSSVTDSSVALQWTQVGDGTGNPANYALRYATPTISWGSASATEVSVSGTSIGATEIYTFKGLQPGTTYQFQVVSYRGTLNVDAVFGGFSNIVSGSTTGSVTLQTPTVTVTPSSLSFTSTGATAQLSAIAKDSTGNTVSNPGFTWRSLASSIASVSSSGLVTAQAVGATAIIVSAACCGSDSVPVQVSTSGTFQTPTVTVTPSSLSFTSIGTTAQLSAVATDSTGNTVSNPGFTWTSLASSIATVSSTGLVTAQATGSTAIVVSAACCGSDTAMVSVSQAVSGSHEPAGYQTIVDEGWSNLQTTSGAWSADGTGIMTTDYGGSNFARTSDATAPQSPPYVLRTRFPSGLSGGSAPGSIMGWDNSYEHGTEYKAIYFSMWLKIAGNGSTYQAYGGVNKFGFFGYGAAPGSVANFGFFDLWPDVVGSGPQQVTHLNLKFQQQNNVVREINTDYTIDCGAGARWHHWELQLILNSAPGVADGILRWWQDGTLVVEKTNMVFITSGDTHGFYHWKWQPYFGGVGYSKSQTDYVYIDHVHISGIPK